MVDVVPVDRPDIEESQLVEQRAAGNQPAGIFLHRHRTLFEEGRQELGELLHGVVHGAVGPSGDKAREIPRQSTDRRRDRHVVVVENNDQAGIHGAGVVHGLIGHAGGHGSVADHGNHMVGLASEVAGHGHAEPGRDRGGRVSRAERIVFAFRALGEAGKSAALSQRSDAVAPAGQNLMRIGLVTDVPDQAVLRRIEDVVEGNRQLDHPKPGAEVPAGDRNRIDRLLAQFVGELAQLPTLQAAQVRRRLDKVEQGGLR